MNYRLKYCLHIGNTDHSQKKSPEMTNSAVIKESSQYFQVNYFYLTLSSLPFVFFEIFISSQNPLFKHYKHIL